MKTKPTGIRFDIDDFEFICKRENLKTPQSVVAFLMKEYVKLYKVEKPSVFVVETTKFYDALEVKNLQDEYIPGKSMKLRRRKSVEEYVIEKRELNSNEEYLEWLDRLNNDEFLTEKQKQLCKTS